VWPHPLHKKTELLGWMKNAFKIVYGNILPPPSVDELSLRVGWFCCTAVRLAASLHIHDTVSTDSFDHRELQPTCYSCEALSITCMSYYTVSLIHSMNMHFLLLPPPHVMNKLPRHVISVCIRLKTVIISAIIFCRLSVVCVCVRAYVAVWFGACVLYWFCTYLHTFIVSPIMAALNSVIFM